MNLIAVIALSGVYSFLFTGLKLFFFFFGLLVLKLFKDSNAKKNFLNLWICDSILQFAELWGWNERFACEYIETYSVKKTSILSYSIAIAK